MHMPLAKECVCCKETKVLLELMKNDEVECITDHPGFEPVCLNTYLLDTAYNQYKQQYNRQIQNIPEWVVLKKIKDEQIWFYWTVNIISRRNNEYNVNNVCPFKAIQVYGLQTTREVGLGIPWETCQSGFAIVCPQEDQRQIPISTRRLCWF